MFLYKILISKGLDMKKQWLLLLVTLLFSNVSFAINGELSGDGSDSSPYLIEDIADFLVFADSENADQFCSNNVHLKLVNNLDFSSIDEFDSAIVNSGGAFEGYFDGNNKIIYNARISVIEDNYNEIGIFSEIRNGIVQDLTLDNISYSTMVSCSGIGGIAGIVTFTSRIENCHVNGNIICSDRDDDSPAVVSNIGGIAGSNSSVIRYCTSDLEITTKAISCGGIAGYCTGEVSNCFTSGNVTGDSKVGGIIGDVNGGEVYMCGSRCDVTCTGSGFSTAGGCVGSLNAGMVEKSYAVGSVSGNGNKNYLGGFAGSDNDAKIVNCYTNGIVNSSSSNAGAFIGRTVFDLNLISKCFYNSDKNPEMLWSSSDDETDAGAKGLSNDQMRSKETFVNAGWKFAENVSGRTPSIWNIYPGFDSPELIANSQVISKLSQGDINADGIIDISDFVILAQNWLDTK